MPFSFASALVNLNCPLFYETDLDHMNNQTIKIMHKNRANREPYGKTFFIEQNNLLQRKKKHFCLLSKEAFLNLDAMDVT